MSYKLDFSTINNGSSQNKAFIMIHGWKGNKDSFNSIPKILDIPNCRWFFPEAPFMVDDNPNKKSWTYEISPGKWEIEKPQKMLEDFLKNEVFNKFHPSDTYIMGFSQGAAVCYRIALSLDYTLGGIFPIGGFIRNYPGQSDDEIKINVSPAQKNTPILIGHGKDDDIVSADSSKFAYKLLKKECNNVELHIYNGRHKISIDFLKKIRELIINKEAINV